MSKNSEEIINKVLNEFKKEQQEKYDKFKKEQKNKFRKFVVFMVVLCLLISGITGVASYTLAANQVGYTARDTSWTVDNTQDAIDELRDTVGYALVGSIFSYMGTFAPFGYLACDGTVYNITDYPRLADHIKTHFGSYNYFGGDGETTFAVPDLRGEFLRGTGTNSHTNQGSGASVGKHQNATTSANLLFNQGKYFGLTVPYGDSSYRALAENVDSSTRTKAASSSVPYVTLSSGTDNESLPISYTSRPTNTSVLYIIKY